MVHLLQAHNQVLRVHEEITNLNQRKVTQVTICEGHSYGIDDVIKFVGGDDRPKLSEVSIEIMPNRWPHLWNDYLY